ncbi:hypothetical protein PYCC9005_001861 [Savitreella phatthalungensis]
MQMTDLPTSLRLSAGTAFALGCLVAACCGAWYRISRETRQRCLRPEIAGGRGNVLDWSATRIHAIVFDVVVGLWSVTQAIGLLLYDQQGCHVQTIVGASLDQIIHLSALGLLASIIFASNDSLIRRRGANLIILCALLARAGIALAIVATMTTSVRVSCTYSVLPEIQIATTTLELSLTLGLILIASIRLVQSQRTSVQTYDLLLARQRLQATIGVSAATGVFQASSCLDFVSKLTGQPTQIIVAATLIILVFVLGLSLAHLDPEDAAILAAAARTQSLRSTGDHTVETKSVPSSNPSHSSIRRGGSGGGVGGRGGSKRPQLMIQHDWRRSRDLEHGDVPVARPDVADGLYFDLADGTITPCESPRMSRNGSLRSAVSSPVVPDGGPSPQTRAKASSLRATTTLTPKLAPFSQARRASHV